MCGRMPYAHTLRTAGAYHAEGKQHVSGDGAWQLHHSSHLCTQGIRLSIHQYFIWLRAAVLLSTYSSSPAVTAHLYSNQHAYLRAVLRLLAAKQASDASTACDSS